MTDTYARLVNAVPVRPLASRLGLPRPPRLERGAGPLSALQAGIVLGGTPEGRLQEELREALRRWQPTVAVRGEEEGQAQEAGALIFDASGIGELRELVRLQSFFSGRVRSLARSGRVIVAALVPERCEDPRTRAAQRALEGFTRALGKELGRRGVTVNLLRLGADAGASTEPAAASLECTLAFLLSGRSAYISGQVITLQAPPAAPARVAVSQPLAGRSALVTGAARGIGAAIAQTLARDGAAVIGVDVAAARESLEATMSLIAGRAITLDITAEDAPARIVGELAQGVDVVVHNAGVTRDRTLGKMDAERFASVIEINAVAVEAINAALLEAGALRENGRIVCLSSIAGIAGNAGQTNYSTSKAGVIGIVQALAPELAARRRATINAVAPGFIETQMTAAMPFAIREAGRRMNSLLQGGLPEDVAETVGWLADPCAGAINGSVVRVCGQSFLGA
jgi:3-oxoacyl-[acyl-carrier protein] reductase